MYSDSPNNDISITYCAVNCSMPSLLVLFIIRLFHGVTYSL